MTITGSQQRRVQVRRTKANRDDECVWCAYPFDPGDPAYVTQGEWVFCSRQCVAECCSSPLAEIYAI